MSIRKVAELFTGQPVIEGAGVHLHRLFGFTEHPRLDPFLLLDDFHANDPKKYQAGFPWHPHRGIETITYMLQGSVAHQDSLGNRGIIEAGDVQWMTAGRGIIHQEMPQPGVDQQMWGLQLWANLPGVLKMTAPKYQEVSSCHIPEVKQENGVILKVIAGEIGIDRGPVHDIAIHPEIIDVTLPPNIQWTHRVLDGHTVFAYPLEGQGTFGDSCAGGAGGRGGATAAAGTLVLFASYGAIVRVITTQRPVRFLLVSGRPLGEAVAWRGPIVMNTEAELEMAFQQYQEGTFIR